MLEKKFEKYLKVKTGQDLINLGIVPKTSSDHLAMIAHKRLVALRDQITSSIDPKILGQWIPAIEPIVELADIIEDPEMIKTGAKPGMKIKMGRLSYQGRNMAGTEGILKEKRDDGAIVELESYGQIPLQYGYFQVIAPEGQPFRVIKGYKLANQVVADANLGHRVRLSESYTGKITDDGGNRVDVQLTPGTTGQLTGYDEKKGIITLRIDRDQKVKGGGNRLNFVLYLNQVVNKLDASSLGQYAPKDLEEVVKEEVLHRFLPRTIMETDRMERIVRRLLMGGNEMDLILYGPPGSGKTQAAKDIQDIAEQQGIIFTVDGCKANCNPYSLFDADFAKVVKPCPECMIQYDQEKDTDKKYQKTGFFKAPKPEQVKVCVEKYGQGNGIEKLNCKANVDTSHLVGFKMLDLEGATDDESDPTGFHPGKLVRANNGVLVLSEFEKLRSTTQDDFLDPLEDGEMTPDELRFAYPTDNFRLGTANDHTKISLAINDRLALIAVRYPTNVDTSYSITRVSVHKEFIPVSEIPIDDTQTEKVKPIDEIPIPVTLERAIDAFYIKFRGEYKGKGLNRVLGSNRSKKDANFSARAKLLLNQVFYKSAPSVVTAEYVASGIKNALCSRIQQEAEQADVEAKEEINAWIDQNYPAVLKEEEGNWWCEVYKDIATSKLMTAEIVPNFKAELKSYGDNPASVKKAYLEVRKAVENPTAMRLQQARLEYPLMNFLFEHPKCHQSRMREIKPQQMIDLISYLMNCRKDCPCPEPQ